MKAGPHTHHNMKSLLASCLFWEDMIQSQDKDLLNVYWAINVTYEELVFADHWSMPGKTIWTWADMGWARADLGPPHSLPGLHNQHSGLLVSLAANELNVLKLELLSCNKRGSPEMKVLRKTDSRPLVLRRKTHTAINNLISQQHVHVTRLISLILGIAGLSCTFKGRLYQSNRTATKIFLAESATFQGFPQSVGLLGVSSLQRLPHGCLSDICCFPFSILLRGAPRHGF